MGQGKGYYKEKASVDSRYTGFMFWVSLLGGESEN